MLLCIYIPFGGIRIKKLKPPQKRKDNMSNEIIVKLEEGLYEDYKAELEQKYFGGIVSGGPDEGTPWFSKSDAEIEEEATKKVQEFMDRNS